MDNTRILLGKRIKEIRKSLNLTQEQLAEKIKIEPNNLSRIENGKNFPTPENLSKIALALEVELRDLFTYNHLKSYDEIKNTIFRAVEKDENMARKIYRFWEAIR